MVDKKANNKKNVNQNSNVESKPLTEKDKQLLEFFNENIGGSDAQIVDHTEKKDEFKKEISEVARETQEKARIKKRKEINQIILNASKEKKIETKAVENNKNGSETNGSKLTESEKDDNNKVENNEASTENKTEEVVDKSENENNSEKDENKNDTSLSNNTNKEDGAVYDSQYTEYRVANDDVVNENQQTEEKSTEVNKDESKQKGKKFSFLNLFNFKKKENKTKDKKNSNSSYKPPFYQSFKFWAIIVACVCILCLIAFIVYSSIKNATPKLPTGIVFETNQGADGYAPQTDLLVLSPNSGTDSLIVKVKFKNNFSGNIKLSLSLGIAKLDKDVISNGDIVVITALRSDPNNENSELIGGKTQLKAEYQTVHAELEILIDKQMTDIALSSSYNNDDATALKNKIGEAEFDNKMNNNLYYVNRPVSLTAKPRFGYITSGNPNDDFSRDVIWESSDTEKAVVDENGYVTSYKSGTVTFTARSKAYYLDKTNTISKSITLKFEDVPIYSLKIKTNNEGVVMDKITLWLSDEAREINVRDYVQIIPSTELPSSFSADYLYNNASLLPIDTDSSIANSLIIKNVENKLGHFTLYNNTTEAETRDGVSAINLTVRFGETNSLWLDNYDNSKITVTIKRNKNLMLTLPEYASNKVQIQNIAFYQGGNLTQTYSRLNLQGLFNLRVIDSNITDNSGEGARGNNFVPSRDIVFEKFDKTDTRFEIEHDSTSNKYYLVPSVDAFTPAMDYGQGFRVIAYLKDINNEDAEIPNTSTETSNTTLFVEVVQPTFVTVTVNESIPTLEISKNSTQDVFTEICGYINKMTLIISSEGETKQLEVNKNNLLSSTSEENLKMPKNKVFIEISRQNDKDIYVNNKTTIGINSSAELNSIHTLTIKFMYVYNVTPPSTSSNPNSNIVELASIDLNIKVK